MRFQKIIISCLLFAQMACTESEETMPPPGSCQPDVCEGVCVANVCTDPSNMPDDPSTGPQCPGNETDCNVACAWAVSCMVADGGYTECDANDQVALEAYCLSQCASVSAIATQTCATDTCEATLTIFAGSRDAFVTECLRADIPSDMGVMAAPEVCDGTDNDLDGTVDEEVTPRLCESACGMGTERCVEGTWVDCDAPEVFQETCDGIDNDCDGVLDEMLTRSCTTACGDGMENCSDGEWVGCSAPAPEIETCDTLDNDCDGQFDENVVQTCDLPAELSMCANPMGIQRCLEGAEWGACESMGVDAEVCGNNRDDDCDGVLDEGCACSEGETRDCSFSIGACTAGVRNCLMDGSFGDCVNAQTEMPVIEPGELPEACNNGQDDDCDGQVDETPCE